MRNSQSLMEVNGLFATINTPEIVKGEETYNLPPYRECPAYVVDEYPACPPNWMHGSANASSYFVPVKAGRGMWFDFTQNINHHHHVAVVISVQGINPITGQQVSKLNLEKYQSQCPVHKIDFQTGRHCPECGYNWPAQSYIATTTNCILWLDGFRNEDGTVRQYIITEEEIKGIAKQLIGDDRVYAIGFAFYLSKNPKPEIKVNYGPSWKTENYDSNLSTPWFSPSGIVRKILKGYPPSNTISPSIKVTDNSYSYNSPSNDEDYWIPIRSSTGNHTVLKNTNDFVDLPGYPQDDASSLQQLAAGDSNLDMYYPTQVDADGNEYSLESGVQLNSVSGHSIEIPDTIEFGPASIPETINFQDSDSSNKDLKGEVVTFKRIAMPLVRKTVETKLEIGAGAKLWQEIGHDPMSLDFWQEEPAGLIYVNYVTEEKAKEIMDAGKIANKKEGFLNGCLVGS